MAKNPDYEGGISGKITKAIRLYAQDEPNGRAKYEVVGKKIGLTGEQCLSAFIFCGINGKIGSEKRFEVLKKLDEILNIKRC